MRPYDSRLEFVICTRVICALVLFGLSLAAFKATPVLAQHPPMHTTAPSNGLFVYAGQALGGETGNGVALGDLDGDGDVDAFVANDVSPPNEANHVWCNEGGGTFVSGPIFGTTDGHAIALGDLDGDDDLDAVIAGDIPNQVWRNDGTSQGCTEIIFTAGQELGAFAGYGVALGDVDQDDDLDVLIVGNSGALWLNNGDGTFEDGPTFPIIFGRAAHLIDLDDDGLLDIVAASSNNQLWWNDGNWNPGPGTFTAGEDLPTNILINSVAAGNLDADNLPDLFLVGSNQDQIFWNEGTRTFTTTGTLPVSDNSFAVVLGDLDSDGDLDGVVGNAHADPNRLWRNEGSGVFTVTQEFGDIHGFYWSRGLALADLNGDQALDLFDVTTADDHVWLNQAAPLQPNVEGWQIQLLESRGMTGLAPALALDGNGHPHITYVHTYVSGYDEEFSRYLYVSRLYYMRWTGVNWQSTPVYFFPEAFDGNVAIAVDAAGDPHIAFVNGLDVAPHYLRWDGANWQHQIIPFTVGGYAYQVDLSLDGNDRPHFTYSLQAFDVDGFLLQYTVWDGTNWQFDTVDSTYDHSPTSLVTDANGNPHIAYISCSTAPAACSGVDSILKYAHKSGATWQKETVDEQVYRYTALALDAQGRPHLAYHTFGPSPASLKHARREGNGWQRQVISPDHRASHLALDVDSSGNPHVFYTEAGARSTVFQYAHLDDATWQITTLDTSNSGDEDRLFTVGMALDGNDRLHAVYHEAEFADLRYLSWAPNWQIRSIAETGSTPQSALDVERTIPYIAYYAESSGQLKFATWDETWTIEPLAFVNQVVTDLGMEGSPTRPQVSYFDADNQRLLYRYRRLGEWQVEVVDETGNAGRYHDLVLIGNIDNQPRIAFWDAISRRIKLAIPDPQSLLWHIHPNLVGPALDENSGMLSASVLPEGDIGIAYYDAANGDLRLAVWDVQSDTWADELVDGAAGNTGRLLALQTDGTEGVPVVAYVDETATVIKLAHKMGGAWEIAEVTGTKGEEVSSLTLELGLQSRTRARIAYVTTDGVLKVAILHNNLWRIEVIAASGVITSGVVASALDSRLHLTYPATAGGLRYAFRTATLDVKTGNDSPPSPGDFATAAYNPLDACQAILDLFFATPTTANQPWPRSPEMAMPLHLPDYAPMADLEIFGAMTTLFAQTPEGQHYIDLYRQHGAEMGQLGLNDDALLMDAYGTLQNFLPGLEALVRGEGDGLLVTQEMVNAALDIWQRLADAGSPALAAAINAELAKTNNLQDFVGMNFDGWAREIGVPPPPESLYMPGLYR